MNDSLVFERTMKVTVTPQAQKVLAATSYSVEEFLIWALKDNGVSFGGHNVAIFLEQKFNEGK
jgi:hypothetical protein